MNPGVRASSFPEMGGPVPRFETLATPNGMAIRAALWESPAGTARGSVALLQGRAEFIEKYCETAGDLLAHGFAVYSFDWRGQGGSSRALAHPHKGHVGDYGEYLSDLDLFLEELVLPAAPRPILVLAHSMGAHIALRHAGDRAARNEAFFAERMVLAAPMVGFARMRAPFTLAALVLRSGLGIRRRGLADMPFEGNPLTRDRSRFERNKRILQQNSTLALGGPTRGWLLATQRSLARLDTPGYIEALRTPITIFRAGADRVVSNAAEARIAARLPEAALETIPDARHELLMETDAVRARLLAGFDSFACAAPAVRNRR